MSADFLKPTNGSSLMPDHIMLSFCGDPRYEIAVTWRTDISVESGYVILSDCNGVSRKIPAISRDFISDIDKSKIHTAQISNLNAGEKYTYTCGSDENRSDTFSFTTQNKVCNKFKFIVISDHQVGEPWENPDYSSVTQMLEYVTKNEQNIKFILTAGDNCDDGQNEIQWNAMFEAFRGYCENMPLMMATGNHDNRGFEKYLPYPPEGKFYLDHADYFDLQFKHSYPENGPLGFETENYSFDYGNVHFCIMGINEPQIVGDWAVRDINSSSAQWKIGVYHFPIYPAIPEGQNDDGYPWLRSSIESLDLSFEGHEHSFARTYPIKNDAMYEKPSQGTVHYQCATGAGGKRSNERKAWHCNYCADNSGVPVYALVEVDGDKFSVTTKFIDGRIADAFTIDKATDTITPPALPPKYNETAMMFKGSIPHISAKGTVCANKNGIWYVPFAVLAQYIGAAVLKENDCLTIEMYEKCAKFVLGESVATVNGMPFDLITPVYKERGQLMINAQRVAEIFGLRCNYVPYNNILDFETEIEKTPLSVQP